MTRTSAFNPEELELLESAILQPALAVSVIERGGTLVEMLTLYDTLAAALTRQESSPLIQGLLQQVVSRRAASTLKAFEALGPDELSSMAVKTLQDALALLERKAEAGERVVYRELVRTVCREVAQANEEPGAIGGSTGAVSASEGALLDEIERVLSA